MIRRWPALTVAALLLWCGAVDRQLTADDRSAEQNEFFEKHIRPLLTENCLSCHGGKKQEGGLQLSSRELLLKGGESGTAVVPSKPDESLLIRAVEYLDEPKMPPKKKLPDADIARLKQWVAMGAPWPDSPSPSAGDDPAGFTATRKQQQWWAFQPVQDSAPPAVVNSEWPRSEIDRFILAELESRGMPPAEQASRRVWLRRAAFDLTGLPPTPEEIAAFETDTRDDAFERVVDRLLASPAYGQRWARHWLDVARYADHFDANPATRTGEYDVTEAWRYRDWVVDAFNADLPFDQFIVHQIAGDTLPSPEGKDFYADGLIATTFLSNGVWDVGDADKEKIVSDMADDNIDVIGKAFLGLTLGCARCHDHKFDPVSTEDYYALAGMFYSSHMLKELGAKGGNYTIERAPLAPAAVVEKRNEQLRQIAEATAKLEALDKQDPKPPADDPQRVELISQRDQFQRELLPEPPLALAMREGGTPGGLFPGIQDVPIHIRGSYARLGPVVPRRLPKFFAGNEQPPIESGSGRRELAAWVASKDNPLTARVIVNRVWQWHFGAGLVQTPSNFGLLSEPPSHPALLDWLAVRFVEEGWSLKALHRRIMLSSVYRQAGSVSREQFERDPENRWLGRFAARRLDAEAIRDAMLCVAGRLDTAAGGPAGDEFTIPRRSLYVQTARWDRGSYAILFDAANPDSSTEKRVVSTVAPQALLLLNHPFTLSQAEHLAERLIQDVPHDETARIQRGYELLFGRQPNDEELAIARRIVQSGDPTRNNAGWIDLTHVLLCSNEFVYID
ncbi:MAG: PSD1 and planctomycete cytochrome C domain-containing protein [Planctomycetaceae bacterium]